MDRCEPGWIIDGGQSAYPPTFGIVRRRIELQCYGIVHGPPRKETDPITANAKSKIGAERELAKIDTDMVVTGLRFATACGISDRLRFDLVLNDFMA
jgi:hypothetical protein